VQVASIRCFLLSDPLLLAYAADGATEADANLERDVMSRCPIERQSLTDEGYARIAPLNLIVNAGRDHWSFLLECVESLSKCVKPGMVPGCRRVRPG